STATMLRLRSYLRLRRSGTVGVGVGEGDGAGDGEGEAGWLSSARIGAPMLMTAHASTKQVQPQRNRMSNDEKGVTRSDAFIVQSWNPRRGRGARSRDAPEKPAQHGHFSEPRNALSTIRLARRFHEPRDEHRAVGDDQPVLNRARFDG